MVVSKPLVGVSGLLMLVALATPGCATKKYVRTQTSPISQRVDEIDKKHTEALNNLENKEQKDVSRVEERAMSAENKATDAGRAAQQADSKATEATNMAKNATDMAQQANTKLGDLSNVVGNLGRYKLLTSEDVLFRFDRATLTKDGQSKLDQLIQQASNQPQYVVEVEGFTDRIGSKDYNLALSRRRADTVVRYLVDHSVPLRQIHMIGLGELTPTMAQQQQQSMAGQPQAAPSEQTAGQPQAAPSEQTAGQTTGTKMKAREMRRVVINLYAPETTLSASANAPQAQPMSQPTTPQTTPPQPQQQPPTPR